MGTTALRRQGRRRMRGRIVMTLAFAALATWPAVAGAATASSPHADVEMTGTTTQPGTPVGTTFTATYHAAGDPNGDPPYMRKMKWLAHPGSPYDHSGPRPGPARARGDAPPG